MGLAEIIKDYCECEADIDIKCHMCIASEIVGSIETIHAENKILKRTNKNLIERHNIHLDALDRYYHRLHKECPCLEPDAHEQLTTKCNSPWRHEGKYNG